MNEPIIKHNEMVAQLAKSGEAIINELSPATVHLWHMATGISGEVGEVGEAIVDEDKIDDVDEENMIEELGDIEFYLEGYRQGVNLSREDTINYTHMTFSQYGKSMDGVIFDYVRLTVAASQLLDATKKAAAYNKEINQANVVNALRDIELYLESIRQHFGIIHEETLRHNVAKLGKRYKGHNYSNEQAHARADKTTTS